MTELVLSLFPGVGLLDMAFEDAGFSVCRAPDLIHGGDIRRWRVPPAGRFDGIIAGPPCQGFSVANSQRSNPDHQSVVNSRSLLQLTVEIIAACEPTWALIENVPTVPDVCIPGYRHQRIAINDWECGGTQLRWRAIQWLSRGGSHLRPRRVNDRSPSRRKGRRPEAILTKPVSRHMTYPQQCSRQGLPCAIELPGWTREAKFRAVGNGVPLRIGRVLAAAIADRDGPATDHDCTCGCGRPVNPPAQRAATVACRKRLQIQRQSPREVFRPCSRSDDTDGTIDDCDRCGESEARCECDDW